MTPPIPEPGSGEPESREKDALPSRCGSCGKPIVICACTPAPPIAKAGEPPEWVRIAARGVWEAVWDLHQTEDEAARLIHAAYLASPEAQGIVALLDKVSAQRGRVERLDLLLLGVAAYTEEGGCWCRAFDDHRDNHTDGCEAARAYLAALAESAERAPDEKGKEKA